MKSRVLTGLTAAALALTLSACGGSGDGPSKDEVKTAFKENVEGILSTGQADMLGGEEGVNKLIDCVIDEAYDETSKETLEKMIDEQFEAEFANADEEKLWTDASATCGEKIAKDMLSGN